MSKNNVFKSYVEIAASKGLIKQVQQADAKHQIKKAKTENQKNYEEKLEMLYGVKPNGDEGDMVDQAHPKPVVISPAHDKINGLVENVKERHDVMRDIAFNTPTGELCYVKHVKAHADLLNELVAIGFDMDNRNKQNIMVMADECSEGLSKQANPIAAIGFGARLAMWGYSALKAAGYVSLAYELLNTYVLGPSSAGVVTDSSKAIEELNNAKAHADSLLKGSIDNAIKLILKIKDLSVKVKNIPPPSTNGKKGPEAAAAIMKNSKKENLDLIDEYLKVANVTISYCTALATKLLDSEEEPEEDEWDITKKLKTVWYSITGSPFRDAANQLKTLVGSLEKTRDKAMELQGVISTYVSNNDDEIKQLLDFKIFTNLNSDVYKRAQLERDHEWGMSKDQNGQKYIEVRVSKDMPKTRKIEIVKEIQRSMGTLYPIKFKS